MMRLDNLRPIELLCTSHINTGFDCGVDALNVFLKNYAAQNSNNGASKTYVCAHKDTNEIVGYYTISYGSIQHDTAILSVKKNMPYYPIPALLIGRLAVDKRYHGITLGWELLKDAMLRAVGASRIAGLKAVVVSAKNDVASEFYKKFGFEESNIDRYTLMVTIQDIEKSLGNKT